MSITTVKKLPGVLSFSRGHMVSSGMFFSRLADGTEIPVSVVRAGIRGTQNTNDGMGNESQTRAAAPAKGRNKAAAQEEGAGTTVAVSERAIANVQVTETARLDSKATALVVRFNLAMLDLANTLNSCAGADRESAKNMRNSVEDFIDRAKKSDAVYAVALRYARNIANGRWLWNNVLIASDIAITVAYADDKTEVATFDAFDIPGKHFDNYSPQEHALAKELADQMKGVSLCGLQVTAVLTPRFSGDVEVFPSENFAKKPTGFARSLYKVGHPDPLLRSADGDAVQVFQDTRHMGYAALRDQKIFNAIRTIDTWYPEYKTMGEPIPVEPLGANLKHQAFFRKGKQSAFEMFKRLVTIDPTSDEGLFCIACLDRGGVYGETDKNAAAPAESTEAKAPETAEA